ncbi:porin [Gillisia limnaea]|uniref:Phosphate-selective porin O and P n=1 Tax=Gillisia limnaea (strain DSM 15749 / LMG 21470 / R-8282) TaxID=865937 RepID=H2BZ33_GILLR|nr:porin [Gillisia limnaea]EHQ03378.1 phosphate-selective porin O and P [Gillisia limnaea DSM 15749]
MRLKDFYIAAFALLLSLYAQGQDITENKFGKGLINVVAKDSSFSAYFGIRFQSLMTSKWDVPENGGIQDGETNFLIRRARLKFEGFAYSPKLTYKFELGLSNRDISGASQFTSNAPRFVLDAVLKWNFYENFELWAGQTKLPGNRERVISSANLETVDRSLLNSRYNIDRDIGLQLHHFITINDTFIIREIVSIAQGEGRNITTGNIGGYQYTGRAEILPFGDFSDYSGADLERESNPKLAVGVSYDYNDNAVKTRSNMGSYMITDTGFFETDIQTLFLDALFKYEGVSIMAEYANREADNPFAVNEDSTPTGDVVNIGEAFNIQAGYLFENNYQVLGRFTSVDPDDDFSELVENQYTLGLSKYLVGHKLKVQTDISYTDLNQDQFDGLMYRLQFEFHL